MQHNNLENKILEAIEKENIKPKPFFYFLVKDYSLWLLVLATILFASVAVSSTLFILQNIDWVYQKHLSKTLLVFIFITLPYFWIALSILAIYFAKKAWEITRNGYKFKGERIVIASILLSLIFGIAFNAVGIGEKVDKRIDDRFFGLHRSLEEKRNFDWYNPEEGRLIGTVKNIEVGSFVLFNERQNATWTISFEEETPGNLFVDTNNKVRVVGLRTDSDKFEGCLIFPEDRRFMTGTPTSKFKMKVGPPTEECRKILEIGRASFTPPQPPIMQGQN